MMINLICPLMEIISSGKSTKFLLKQQHKHPSPPSSITNINRRFQESKRKFPTYGIFPHFSCFFWFPTWGVLHVRRYMYIKYTVPEEKIKEKILNIVSPIPILGIIFMTYACLVELGAVVQLFRLFWPGAQYGSHHVYIVRIFFIVITIILCCSWLNDEIRNAIA